MNRSDRQVNIIVVILILMYLSVLITVFVSNMGHLLIPALNLLSGLSVIVYWARKQLAIQQHYFGVREITVLIFETVVICCALYPFITYHWYSWLRIIQYIYFSLHFTVLVSFLIYMLTFKFKRLI